MATVAQITANRCNAQKSTGPKSPEGKEACKYNATRHGLTGKQIVIKGEDPEQYDALLADLIAQHQPASEAEAMLVNEIAQNWWRLQRVRQVEAKVLDMFGALECIIDPDARIAFRTCTRYLNSIENSWRKACQDLARAQKLREIGSVSQTEATRPVSIASVLRNTVPLTPFSSAENVAGFQSRE